MSTTLQFHRSSDERDTAALIADMMALDRQLYVEAAEEDLGSAVYWRERFERCPETLSLARMPDGTLAGYYQFLPVTAAYRDEVLAGRARDGAIPLESIVPYQTRGAAYHLYLCSMAVRPEWRGRGVASRLYLEEAAFQQRLALSGRRLESLVSVVWSACGARFFERIGLPRRGTDFAGRAVHYRTLPDGLLPEIAAPAPRRIEALPQAA
jgi:GNAT superfamily N-acetyltransferase